jgi:hypothetical protein
MKALSAGLFHSHSHAAQRDGRVRMLGEMAELDSKEELLYKHAIRINYKQQSHALLCIVEVPSKSQYRDFLVRSIVMGVVDGPDETEGRLARRWLLESASLWNSSRKRCQKQISPT